MRILAQILFNEEGNYDKIIWLILNNFNCLKYEKYQMFRMR